jgi:hypothetical protein
MTRDESLKRLQAIKERGILALMFLEAPQTSETEVQIRLHIEWLRNELKDEFVRTSPERVQKTMTIFEKSVCMLRRSKRLGNKAESAG